MEVLRYALIDRNGFVINAILWDGITPFIPPDNLDLIQSDIANRGDTFDGDKFVSPPVED